MTHRTVVMQVEDGNLFDFLAKLEGEARDEWLRSVGMTVVSGLMNGFSWTDAAFMANGGIDIADDRIRRMWEAQIDDLFKHNNKQFLELQDARRVLRYYATPNVEGPGGEGDVAIPDFYSETDFGRFAQEVLDNHKDEPERYHDQRRDIPEDQTDPDVAPQHDG